MVYPEYNHGSNTVQICRGKPILQETSIQCHMNRLEVFFFNVFKNQFRAIE